jgi:hypothetical protein
MVVPAVAPPTTEPAALPKLEPGMLQSPGNEGAAKTGPAASAASAAEGGRS